MRKGGEGCDTGILLPTMKIVVLDGYTENPGDISWDGFKACGELTVYERTRPEEVDERLQDAEIAIINKVRMTREIMQAHPNLRYIGVLATGYDVVDVKAAKELNIAVTNVPGYGTDTVAQYAIGMLLEVCFHIAHHNERVKDGEWSRSKDWCFWDYPLIELAGKTMGIIGYGRIGKQVAKIAKAMGMQIQFYHPREKKEEGAKQVSLEELLRSSDVVSLHCPLTSENEGIINKDTLSLMKPTAILLNNARGKLIKEADLAQALQEKWIYGAALDVVCEEPIQPDNPLLQCDNCIITPHISWASKEARERIMHMAEENLACFLQGKQQHRIV